MRFHSTGVPHGRATLSSEKWKQSQASGSMVPDPRFENPSLAVVPAGVLYTVHVVTLTDGSEERNWSRSVSDAEQSASTMH